MSLIDKTQSHSSYFEVIQRILLEQSLIKSKADYRRELSYKEKTLLLHFLNVQKMKDEESKRQLFLDAIKLKLIC